MKSIKNDIEKSKFLRLLILKNHLFLFFSISFCIFLSSSTYSQDSLSYYLEQAALNNPGVKARFLEYSAALEKLPQASSLPDPEIQSGYFIPPMELLGGNQIAEIRLMQMFPWFGALKAAKDEASKMALAKFENFRNAKNELYFNVRAAYYKVYRTQKEIEVAEKNLKILKTLEQLALIKFRSGGTSIAGGLGSSVSTSSSSLSSSSSGMNGDAMSGQGRTGTGITTSTQAIISTGSSDNMGGSLSSSMGNGSKGDMVNLLRIRIEIQSLENRIALLKDQLISDKVGFNLFLNRYPLSEVFTGDSLIEPPVISDILSLTDSIANHPMVKMYKAEALANAAKLTMATRMGYPMLGLGLNYMLIRPRSDNTSMMNGKDMIMPMVSVTLPIYRKKYKAMQQEAEYMREAATESAVEMMNNLQFNFHQTMQDYNDATRRVKLYKDQALLADKSVQLLITSFSASGSDFEEILRMQQQLLDFEFKLIEAVVDKNTSTARLIYLTGID